jgi:DNA-directed RNA polymerase subunit RPC12/RpoP
MTRASANNDMRCPNCGSHYTQFLPTCFSLTRQSGRYSPNDNEFHKLIERPERRSCFLLPVSVLLGVYFVGTLAISVYHQERDSSWIRTHSEFSPEVVVPALLLGALCGLLAWSWAWRYNRDRFPSEFDSWSASAICRRCSTRFLAPDRIVAAYRKQTR